MNVPEDELLKENPALRRPVVPAEHDVYTMLSAHGLLNDFDSPADVTKPAHWSIAWSDLMMTMFILFLSMFVYQSAQQDFLAQSSNEIVSGTTTEAFDLVSETDIPGPFERESKLSFISAGTLPTAKPQNEPGNLKEQHNTTEEIEQRQIDTQFVDSTKETKHLNPPSPPSLSETGKKEVVTAQSKPKNIALLMPELPKTEELQTVTTDSTTVEPVQTDSIPKRSISEKNDDIFPLPLTDEPNIQLSDQVKDEPKVVSVKQRGSQLQDLFALSKKVVGSNNLNQFATVDLVPDKTVRIILTGDLLFDLGSSELNSKALSALSTITDIIKTTPYMINIVGHTDNLPMTSGRYPSNWELSVARASSVARFLIDEVKINPNQLAVSGYASYRPIKPNTNAANRAANRRVEIIITKRLPQPLMADDYTKNLSDQITK